MTISSCGHAQVPSNLQFQPINNNNEYPQQQSVQQAATTQGFNNSPQGFNNPPQVAPQQPAVQEQYPAHFPGSSAVQTQAPVQLNGQRYQQIVAGSERFALDLFSVSVNREIIN